jgi:hypothetical protein
MDGGRRSSYMDVLVRGPENSLWRESLWPRQLNRPRVGFPTLHFSSLCELHSSPRGRVHAAVRYRVIS